MVINNMDAYATSTAVGKDKYFEDLTKNLASTKKSIYRLSADVVGRILVTFDQDDNQEMFKLVFEKINAKLKEMKKVGWDVATTRARWLDCLYCCFMRYPSIVGMFANSFIYGLQNNVKIKGSCLTQCLEMMQGAVDYLRTNVVKGSEWSKEIAMLDLYHFLSHPNTPNQSAALRVIETIVKHMDFETEVETISRIFDCFSSAFINHISTSCR